MLNILPVYPSTWPVQRLNTMIAFDKFHKTKSNNNKNLADPRFKVYSVN